MCETDWTDRLQKMTVCVCVSGALNASKADSREVRHRDHLPISLKIVCTG